MSDRLPRIGQEQRLARSGFRERIGLPPAGDETEAIATLVQEIREMAVRAQELSTILRKVSGKSVIFAGQAYYNAWFLSRELRRLGWKADLLDWAVEQNSPYSFGYDFGFTADQDVQEQLEFFIRSVYGYSLYHFSNAHGISLGGRLDELLNDQLGLDGGIWLLKSLGKRIIYSLSGCLDGVSQTAFSAWGKKSVCAECRWQYEPVVCSDERNLRFGARRNALVDFGILFGGNRVDWNADAKFHEVPQFYCLDPSHWTQRVRIPLRHRIRRKRNHVIFGQGFGEREARTRSDGKDIKSHYIYDTVFEGLQESGEKVQLQRWSGVNQHQVRYYVAQCDVVIDMLTYGWFGAQVREAMMMGKPVVCYLRPEWIEQVAREQPDYVSELPVVSAEPGTVSQALRELANDQELRLHLGRTGRAFAMKWHSSPAAALEFDALYDRLLSGHLPEPAPYPSLRVVQSTDFVSTLASAPTMPDSTTYDATQ